MLAPTPYHEGGPPIWVGSTVARGVGRAATNFDGWFPFGPDAKTFAQRRQLFLENAAAAGRDAGQLTTALYLTVAIMDDAHAADTAINVYLQNFTGYNKKGKVDGTINGGGIPVYMHTSGGSIDLDFK